MLHRVSTESQQPKMLLESVNPYESRRLTVEFDGVTTAAYLHDETSTVAATWIANHVPAPAQPGPGPDRGRPGAHHAVGHTKLPRRPPADRARHAGSRSGFEEGDGVAVLENGEAARGHPRLVGRAPRDARLQPGHPGPTPFGWSLDDAMEGLGPGSTGPGLLQWRSGRRSWGVFQQGGARAPGAARPRQPLLDASMGAAMAGISERPAG